MSAPLDEVSARRLVALLTLAADPSAGVGEAANAARAAGRLVQRLGLTWESVVRPPATGRHGPPPPPPPGADAGDGAPLDAVGARALASEVLRSPGFPGLSDWQADFVRSMAGWSGPVSERQAATLRQCAAKAARCAAEGARA